MNFEMTAAFDSKCHDTGGNDSRPETEFLAVNFGAHDLGAAQTGCRPDGGQVLGQDAGARAPAPYAHRVKRLQGQDGERQRRAQDLATAFTLRAINVDHGAFRRTWHAFGHRMSAVETTPSL